MNGTQCRLHLSNFRRSIHVEGEAETREETRKPVHDRAARSDDENDAPRPADRLHPSDEKRGTKGDEVADEAAEPRVQRGPSAHLPCEGNHYQELNGNKGCRGTRTHDERIEHEKG